LEAGRADQCAAGNSPKGKAERHTAKEDDAPLTGAQLGWFHAVILPRLIFVFAAANGTRLAHKTDKTQCGE